MNAFNTLKKQSVSTLVSLLDDMFTTCDDLYFDLASAAGNNFEQNLYFESMREVRVRTNGAKQAFEQGLVTHFDELEQVINGRKSQKNELKEKDQTAEPALSDMAMLDDEQTEKEITLTSMVSRAKAISKTSLHEIESRLQQLVPKNAQVDEANNPIDPTHIINGFAVSIDEMALEIRARIILYKQFERIVVKRLPEFYLNVNKKLGEAGLSYDRSRDKRHTNAMRGGQSADTAVAGLESDESLVSPIDSSIVQIPLGQLSGLLQQHRHTESPRFPFFTSSGSGPAINSDELVDLLDTSTRGYTDSSAPFDLRTFVTQALGRAKQQGQKHSVSQVDEDVINLVAMFFDFALEDEEIPDNVKALLGRLQMPTLKIALQDNTFFADSKHPCREFINRVATISIGVDAEGSENDTLLENIESWVHDISSRTQTSDENFDHAFTEAIVKVEQYAKKVEKRSELVEKRTTETAEGEAIKQVAKLKAQQAIHEVLNEKKIEIQISQFIVEDWQETLFNAYIRSGDESNDWTACLQVMQDLVWCAQSNSLDEKSSKRLDRILQDLDNRIAEGLKLTSLSDKEIQLKANEVIDVINQFHNGEEINEATTTLEHAIEVFETASSEELSLFNQKKEQTKDWDSMSALERQQYQHEQATFEYIEKAEAVEIGTWVEFKVPSTGTALRCKLATKLEESDSYIFVNRLGFKTIEKTRKEFAYEMQRKRARLLKSGAFFDRSLGGVLSALKSGS